VQILGSSSSEDGEAGGANNATQPPITGNNTSSSSPAVPLPSSFVGSASGLNGCSSSQVGWALVFGFVGVGIVMGGFSL